MTALVPQHSWRTSLTLCPRCAVRPGSSDGPKSWLQELTIVDGVYAIHAVLCRWPSCGFAETLGVRAAADAARPRRRRRWLRDAVAARPATFVLAALVHGIAIGVLLALR